MVELDWEIFITPYVSLGTIIGIPADALISLLFKKIKEEKEKTNLLTFLEFFECISHYIH